MQWQNLLWVGIGGFFGANLRYIFSSIINQYVPKSPELRSDEANLEDVFIALTQEAVSS